MLGEKANAVYSLNFHFNQQLTTFPILVQISKNQKGAYPKVESFTITDPQGLILSEYDP